MDKIHLLATLLSNDHTSLIKRKEKLMTQETCAAAAKAPEDCPASSPPHLLLDSSAPHSNKNEPVLPLQQHQEEKKDDKNSNDDDDSVIVMKVETETEDKHIEQDDDDDDSVIVLHVEQPKVTYENTTLSDDKSDDDSVIVLHTQEHVDKGKEGAEHDTAPMLAAGLPSREPARVVSNCTYDHDDNAIQTNSSFPSNCFPSCSSDPNDDRKMPAIELLDDDDVARRNSFRGGWQLETDHSVERREMVVRVAHLLRERKSNATKEWLQRLPSVAKRLESQLFQDAGSFSQYHDPSTLNDRLQEVVQRVGEVVPRHTGTPSSTDWIPGNIHWSEDPIDLTDDTSPPTLNSEDYSLLDGLLDNEALAFQDLPDDLFGDGREIERKNVASFMASMSKLLAAAHPGEFVFLSRSCDPFGDPNSIQVSNLQDEIVGHIVPEEATMLAPLVDKSSSSSECYLEAYISLSVTSSSQCCNICFFVQAPPNLLDKRAHEWNRDLQQTFGAHDGFCSHVPLDPPKVESSRMSRAIQMEELDQLFEHQALEQLKNLPDIPIPPQLKIGLLPHQEQGLRWLVRQDTTPMLPFHTQVEEGGKKVWHCSITKCSQIEKPASFMGGILADEMGLGKTIQTLGLLLAAPPAENEPRCTLIVCPVSVMENWMHQISCHVKAETLKVRMFHGKARPEVLSQVKKGEIDVLLVSYHTLAAEYDKAFGKQTDEHEVAKKPRVESLFDHKFHRACLDEAHSIRNARSRFFKACQEIQARSRWALTGTPFVNKIQDLYPLLAFVGVEPLKKREIYSRAVVGSREKGLACLRVTMAHVSLRRSKASTQLSLAEKTVHLSKISFPDGSPHKTVYNALFGTVRVAFQAVLREGEREVLKNYSNVFEKILRLRQACCSGQLIPKARRNKAIEIWKELNERPNSSPQLTAEEGVYLLKRLKGAFETEDGDDLPECAVCLIEMDESESVILKECCHVFCEDCIRQVAQSSRSNCPLCRRPFQSKDMIKKSLATSVARKASEESKKVPEVCYDKLGNSPKIAALLDAINTNMQSDEKGVVFSQFTGFLDLIAAAMTQAGHVITRLDGSMRAAQRAQSIQAFSSDEVGSPRFILCSLHAAGTGVNLTRGSIAFMMDCWWNPFVESQAMDRIHRIGQRRPVSVYRFVMKDSIEERIIEMQEAKLLEGKATFRKLKPEEKRQARLRVLRGLLAVN